MTNEPFKVGDFVETVDIPLEYLSGLCGNSVTKITATLRSSRNTNLSLLYMDGVQGGWYSNRVKKYNPIIDCDGDDDECI